MKKVLLVGELNEIMRSLNECLSEDFQIQMCSEETEHVQGMLKIVKPDLIIVSQIGIEEVDKVLFDFLQKEYTKIPVLIIGKREDWSQCREYCQTEQFDKLFRPIVKDELVAKCYDMLHIIHKTNNRYYDHVLKKILVIDDSSIVLRNIKAILSDKYEVFVATSGEMALKMIPNKNPDLILLDYEMPGWDGRKTFQMFLQDEFAKDIPVVFLTGVAEREDVYAVLKSMPHGYILKPPNKDKLLETIKDVLNGDR